MSNRPRIAYVDGPRLKRAFLAACAHARQFKGELNRINVFPVPDGDTGTNLALTLDAIAAGLAGSGDRRADDVAATVARLAVVGARGNCGMMVSQFLLGFARALKGRARVAPDHLGEAMMAGSRALDGAVQEPVEGTILTVARDAAGAASRAPADVVDLVERAVAAARESLERTPELLPVLAQAGVVDAGAQGFVRVVEGVAELIARGDPRGRDRADWTVAAPASGAAPEPRSERPEWSPIGAMDHPLGERTKRYCTEILVEGPDMPGEATVRAALSPGSEELLVIRSDEILKVHLHTDDPEAAIGYCGTIGTVTAHKAEDMFAQFETARDARGGTVRRPVGILVDSGSDLPEAVMRTHGIHMVPLLLVDGEKTLRDRVDMSTEAFLSRLDEDDAHLTTSQPPPGQFQQACQDASADSEVVVAILFSAALSGIFQSAQHGGQLAPELNLRLVDSRAASLLTGLLALKAAELAETGSSPDEIVAEVERIRGQSGIAFTVRNLDRLIASGRISHFAGWLGGFLDLKPVLALDAEGKVAAVGRARGSRRVRTMLIETIVGEIPPDARKVRFGIVHAGAPEIVPGVRSELESRFPNAEILVSPITPVLANHLGRGAWGIGYIVEDQLD